MRSSLEVTQFFQVTFVLLVINVLSQLVDVGPRDPLEQLDVLVWRYQVPLRVPGDFDLLVVPALEEVLVDERWF